MVRCSGVPKSKCIKPCEWIVGKGCFKGVETPPKKSPHGRTYAFLGFKNDDLKKTLESLENKVTYGLKPDTTHVVYKKDKRIMPKIEGLTIPKTLLSDFLAKYNFDSAVKSASPAPTKPTPAKKKVTIKEPTPSPSVHSKSSSEHSSSKSSSESSKSSSESSKSSSESSKSSSESSKNSSEHAGGFDKFTCTVKNIKLTPDNIVKQHLNTLKYMNYSLNAIFNHAKGAINGMFGSVKKNNVKAVIMNLYYIPSHDKFMMPLRTKSEEAPKDSERCNILGVEFTYDPSIKYKIKVDKNAVVLLENHKFDKVVKGEDIMTALKKEYSDAIQVAYKKLDKYGYID